MIGVKIMANNKKTFNTPIDVEIAERFRQQCKSLNVAMNTILEVFMRDFGRGKFLIGMEKDEESGELVFTFNLKDKK